MGHAHGHDIGHAPLARVAGPLQVSANVPPARPLAIVHVSQRLTGHEIPATGLEICTVMAVHGPVWSPSGLHCAQSCGALAAVGDEP